ncbi:hypothetical protein HGRIS_012239 [Hohenbuehelia grisea]|uniref:JmjC domain-containing protein n=1 Tax=Hohenbuehelia grisea TaxID=104357 RepID=A0ABR3IRM4_9AGAR
MEFKFGDMDREVEWHDALLRAKDYNTDPKVANKKGFCLPTTKWRGAAYDSYWGPSKTVAGMSQQGKDDSSPQKSDIHARGRLRKFLDQTHKPTACVNLLDIASEDRNRAWFVNALCDHSKSITQTEKRNYKGVRQVAGKNPVAKAGPPQSFNRDFYALNEWKLLTSAGYLTFPHHNAGGLCTYITMKTGLKIWGFFVPKSSPGVPSIHLPDAVDAILELENWKAFADLYLIMLTPGCVLIQPPGLLHLVYSPVKSIASGGHFLVFDALHLTAWSRRLENAIGLFSTNAEHPCVERYLARMILALEGKKGHIRPLKPLAALALMLLDLDAFEPEGVEVERDEEWINEVEAAKKLAVQIALCISKLKQGTSTLRLVQTLKHIIQEGDNGTVMLPPLLHQRIKWQ